MLFVDSPDQLIAVRAAMGIGGALIMPATLSIISNVFPREERGKAIGIWAGHGLDRHRPRPLMGGLLLEWFDWTSVFLLNVPVALIALVAGAKLVPESRDPEPGAFDFPGALLSIAALSALVYGVIEAPEMGWTSATILGCFAAFLVLAVAFVALGAAHDRPMLNLQFFRNPRFSIASAGISLAFFSLFGAIFALTQFLQDAHGYSALEAGAAMTPLALGLVIGAGSSIKLNERLGTPEGRRRRPARPRGPAGVQPALERRHALLADRPVVLPHRDVDGLDHGPATDSVMGAVPEEKSGVASAMNDVTRQVAGALGTAVIGSLITSLYASRIGDSAAALPEEARAAEDSIGQANAVAAHLPAEQARAWPTPRPTRSRARSASASPSPPAPRRCSPPSSWKLRLPERHRTETAPATAALAPAPPGVGLPGRRRRRRPGVLGARAPQNPRNRARSATGRRACDTRA